MKFNHRLAIKLDWSRTLGYLSNRLVPGVEQIQGCHYRRSVSMAGNTVLLDIHAGPATLTTVVTPATTADVASDAAFRRRLRAGVGRMFVPGEEIARGRRTLARDPGIWRLVRRLPGLGIPQAYDGFELLVRAVAGQQVTVKGASTLCGRLASRFGRRLDTGLDGPDRLFPGAAELAEADLGGLGFTHGRVATLNALARGVALGEIDLGADGDDDILYTALSAVRGIGDWTIQYFLLRARGRLDAFPATDLGLLRAAERLGIASGHRELTRAAEQWRPYRGLAAMYLWHAPPGPD